jgi:hypothetical protein
MPGTSSNFSLSAALSPLKNLFYFFFFCETILLYDATTILFSMPFVNWFSTYFMYNNFRLFQSVAFTVHLLGYFLDMHTFLHLLKVIGPYSRENSKLLDVSLFLCILYEIDV